MLERIQKIISAAGVTSRRAAEELIAEGRVRVNGQVVTELGTKADASKDHIKVDGKLINPKQPQTYIMLHKPVGYVTTMSDPEGRPTVQDLLKGVKVRVYPVGRLDFNTEGMLILTNDGDFAHLVTHPKHELPKTYLAKIKGVLDEKAIESLERGVFLDDGKTAPAKLKKIRKEEANSWVEITIHEGRKRQVRRMFDRVGRSVIRLKRIRTGNLSLGDLPEGQFRHLTLDEVKGLKELSYKTEGRTLMPLVRKSEDTVSSVAGQSETVADKPRGASVRRQRPDEGRVRGAIMQDTGDGRRKNQVVRPGAKSDYSGIKRPVADRGVETRSPDSYRPATKPSSSRPTTGAGFDRPAPRAITGNRETRRVPAQRSWASTKSSESRSKGPGAAPGYGARSDSSSRSTTRPAVSRPTTRTGIGRPASGAGMGTSDVRRKPDQRPWPSTRKSAPRSKGPGAVPGYGPRSDSSSRPVTRTDASRPISGAGAGRPALGSATARPETRRKPEPRSWPGERSSDSRSKSPGYAPRGEARRPSSGPRPNRSTYTGNKGSVRGKTGPGPRTRGQGASGRGPRR